MKNFPCFCVDDFYEKPDEVRNFALKELAENPISEGKSIYPGSRTRQLKEINPDLYRKFCYKFFSIFYDMEVCKLQWAMDTTFQLVPPFHKDKDSVKNTGWIHLDGNVVCAGIVYLTPDIEISAGTSAFRLDDPKGAGNQDEKRNFYSTGEFGEGYESALLKHNRSFTETVRFNNIYNRLVGFDASTWHGVNSYFTEGEPRLTQVFFVHALNTQSGTPILRCKSY